MNYATMTRGLLAALIGVGLATGGGAADVPAGRDYHVSVRGDDANDGIAAKMLRTISAAALQAQPGDVITVHEGTYRERINPPRGGTSDNKRIVYQAASGEKVVIKGSEVIKGWGKVQNDTWKVTLPNSFFGDFNPYADLINGDWFHANDREHHTGAVYLNEHWLTEAATLEDVLKPVGEVSYLNARQKGRVLMNVAWLRPGQGAKKSGRIPAAGFTAENGVKTAPCTEGGECIGWLEHGDWVRYEGVDFGESTRQIEIRAASASNGGIIDIRLNQADGKLLGTCVVPNTGDWQSWKSFTAKIKPLSGVKTLFLSFREARQEKEPRDGPLWFAQVDSENTSIWAQFDGINPNEKGVEINVRQSVFYPDKAGRNFITVRGFTMEHAATPWAPPTAEQIGLIGTHWSKGWLIENNTIRYSTCVGVTLGKHGDEFDNTSANSAEGYVKTIERGQEHGWSKENIGHHMVRNNHIAHCEQAGIVGSLGPIFSTVTGNTIHDIHVRRLFGGAEMAGIKFHGAIDTLISDNHIYRTSRGIWLDWMTQGTRVTRNLLHDNGPREDLFVEVNHGPFMVDNNLLLSTNSINVNSQGGAYVHNLIAGKIHVHHSERRETPYHKAHSTEVAGLHGNPSGDDRYYNNIFLNVGLEAYDPAILPVFMAGNVFLKGAKASKHEEAVQVWPDFDPEIDLLSSPEGVTLKITLDKTWAEAQSHDLVTSERLGRASIPDLPYLQPDGSPYHLDTDYFGKKRDEAHPFPGPFELPAGGRQTLNLRPANGSIREGGTEK